MAAGVLDWVSAAFAKASRGAGALVMRVRTGLSRGKDADGPVDGPGSW